MKAKQSLLFLMLFSLTALVSCESDDDAAADVEGGVTAKLEVLNEKGVPTSVLSAGEKTYFRLSFINHSDSVVTLPPQQYLFGLYQLWDGEEHADEEWEFMYVHAADGSPVDRAYLPLIDFESDYYIEPQGQLNFLLPWDVKYQDTIGILYKDPLEPGRYYCSFNLYLDKNALGTATSVYVEFEVR